MLLQSSSRTDERILDQVVHFESRNLRFGKLQVHVRLGGNKNGKVAACPGFWLVDGT